MQESTPKHYEPIDTLTWDAGARVYPEYFAAVDDREHTDGLLWFAGSLAMKSLPTKLFYGGVAAATAVTALGSFMNRFGMHAEVNLDTATATSRTEIIDFLKGHEIRVATMHSSEEYAAKDVFYNVFIDFMPINTNYKANKLAEGVVETEFFVPPEMVKSVVRDQASGKTVITLEPSFFEVNSHWVDVPNVSNYKLNNGKMEVCKDDCMEPQNSLGLDVAELGTHVNMNTWKNTINDINKLVDRKIQNAALANVQLACAKPMDEKVRNASIEGVKGAWSALTGDKEGKAVSVVFAEGDLKWNGAKVSEEVKKRTDDVYKYDEKVIKIHGEPKLTKTECDTSGAG
jgi:hypothetical protein